MPAPTAAPELFQRLRSEAKLILVTAEAAGWLPQGVLTGALAANRPLVLVIPDVRGRSQPPDVSAALRRQLGMAE